MIHSETAFELSKKMKSAKDEKNKKILKKKSKKKLKNIIKFINKEIYSLIKIGEDSLYMVRDEGYDIPWLNEDEIINLNSYYSNLGYSSYFGVSGEVIKIDWDKSALFYK